MTGETLRECPFCGSTDLYNAFPRSAAESGVIACRGCGAEGPDAGPPDRHIAQWQSRALGPALDKVIEAVEAGSLSAESVERFRIQMSGAYWTDEEMLADFVAALRALRAEQSADAGGERGGG